MVWMEPMTFPSFNKLWGIIDKPLDKGNYVLKIQNEFNAKSYHSEKSFVMKQATYEATNKFVCYTLVAASGVLIMTFLFICMHTKRKSRIRLDA